MPIEQGQNWLLKAMHDLNYQINPEGMCFGVAHMAMQAILCNQIEVFDKRLQDIYQIVKEEDNITQQIKEPIESFLKKQIENSRIYVTTNRSNAKPEDLEKARSLLDIQPFFEGVVLYQHPERYPNLFEQTNRPLHQDALASMTLTLPQSFDNQEGIIKADEFLGIYNHSELINHLKEMQEVIESANITEHMAIPMILQSGDHAVTLSYDVTKKKWFFIDANQLPSKEFDVENYAALADTIIKAFSGNNYAGFKTEIYINKSQEKFFSNVVQNDKWQALHKSAIKKGVADSAGHSLLFLASRLGQRDVVKSLLDQKENPNQGRFDNAPPLFVAAQNGHIDIVKILLNEEANPNYEKANPNLARKDGATPLFMATQFGYFDIVNLLLKNGADPSFRDFNDVSPLYLAAQNGNDQIVKLLIDNKADLNQARNNGETPLFAAAKNGNFNIVELLIANKSDLYQANNNGETPLFIAAKNGNFNIVNLLVANKADLNQASNNGETPLFIAAEYGQIEALNILLEAGANVNIPDNKGATPLNIAAQYGYTDIVKSLLENNAKVDLACNATNATPIFIAALMGHEEVLKLLLGKNADFKQTTTLGDTPLSIAVENQHVNVVKSLLEAGANPNEMRNGISLLFNAVQKGNFELINCLVQKGAEINMANEGGDGMTPLQLTFARLPDYEQVLGLFLLQAVKVKDVKTIGEILDRYPNVLNFSHPETHETLFSYASSHGISEIAELFIMPAIKIENNNLINEILDLYPNTLNFIHPVYNVTPLTYASDLGATEIAENLKHRIVEKKVDAFIKALEEKKTDLISQRKSTVSNFFTSITPYNKSLIIKAIDALIENLTNNKKIEKFDPKSIAQHVHVLLDGETGKLIKKNYPELHEKLNDFTSNQSLKLKQ